MSIFFDLFNPNNRHRTEELRRLENTREDESPGEPGRGPIDLNSGTVLIRVPTKESAQPDDEAQSDGEAADDEGEYEDAADATADADAVDEDPARQLAADEGSAG